MQQLKLKEILEATNGELICGDKNAKFTNVSINSREIADGDLFIPIVGDRFDGHDFIVPSFKAGASASLTHKKIDPIENKSLILVDDTTKALGDLASFYRDKFDIPFVGITGSVGKTSTKDMVAVVLSQKFNVLKTEGNFNNEIGLPLTLLNLDSFHEAAVIEMGTSAPGEISRLTSITKPDITVITNIGTAHIEKFGSRQNILKAKLEILEGLSEGGIVVLNGDDNLLGGMKELLKFRTIFYGMEDGHDYQAYNVKTFGEAGTIFEITIRNHEYKIHIPAPGTHNVYNALAAIAIGMELNIPVEKIVSGISEYIPYKMRLNITNRDGIKIINDVYNASPQSMEAAINVLKDVGSNGRTVAILGDMLEMGEWAATAHYGVGKFAASKGINFIIGVGENGKDIVQGAIDFGTSLNNLFSFENNSEVNEFLKGFIRIGDIILVKGSRGMKGEEIVDYIEDNIERI